jgi:hypothetical protein
MQNPAQLLTYVPELKYLLQNTWVTSERIIHSYSTKKSHEIALFRGRLRPALQAGRGVHIVHAVRNNTLCMIGLITRWSLFLCLWGYPAFPA